VRAMTNQTQGNTLSYHRQKTERNREIVAQARRQEKDQRKPGPGGEGVDDVPKKKNTSSGADREGRMGKTMGSEGGLGEGGDLLESRETKFPPIRTCRKRDMGKKGLESD